MFICSKLYRHLTSPSWLRVRSVAYVQLGTLLLIYPAIAFSFPVSAVEVRTDAPGIIAVTSGKNPVYDQVIEHLNRVLGTNCSKQRPHCLRVEQMVLTSDEIARRITAAQPDLLISLGSRAAKRVAASLKTIPTLYALLPKSIFETLPECCQGSVSALYIDHPLDRQIRLIRAALPSDKRLGVLYGPSSRTMEKELQGLTSRAGMQLESELVMNRKGVGAALKSLLKRVDLLLALPESVVYSKQTVFNLLLSSYHNSVPVISFSEGYVNAGALLAIHSTPEQIGQQLAEMVKNYFSSGQQSLPQPQYPAYFSIAINKSVARSFNLNLPDEDTLHKRAAGVYE